MKTTKNFGLPKPEPDDFYDIDAFGKAMDTLDTKLKEILNTIDEHSKNKTNPHSVSKSQVGLENVENKSSQSIRNDLTASDVTRALTYTPTKTSEVVLKQKIRISTSQFNYNSKQSGATGTITINGVTDYTGYGVLYAAYKINDEDYMLFGCNRGKVKDNFFQMTSTGGVANVSCTENIIEKLTVKVIFYEM